MRVLAGVGGALLVALMLSESFVTSCFRGASAVTRGSRAGYLALELPPWFHREQTRSAAQTRPAHAWSRPRPRGLATELATSGQRK